MFSENLFLWLTLIFFAYLFLLLFISLVITKVILKYDTKILDGKVLIKLKLKDKSTRYGWVSRKLLRLTIRNPIGMNSQFILYEDMKGNDVSIRASELDQVRELSFSLFNILRFVILKFL